MMIDIDLLIKNSMKSRNRIELQAYQNLKAEIQKFKTAKNAKPYNEVTEIGIISKYSRSLEDAIKQFSEAHRDDLVSEYTSEWEVLKKLLPEPVDESQILGALIEWARTNLENFKSVPEYDPKIGAVISNITMPIPKKEMGNVIKYLKSKFPTADGKMISDLVKKYVI